MKAKKVFGIFFSIVSILSLAIGIYGVCYETMDIFSMERAKGFIDLTPYLILLCAIIFLVSTSAAIILFKTSEC